LKQRIYMSNCKKSKIITLFGIFLTCILVSCSLKNGSNEQEITTEANEYRISPTEKWEHSNPENEGISNDTLSELYKKYGKQGTILIVRNGKILAENYPIPFDTCYLHHIHSCTKSITSILAGIAIDKSVSVQTSRGKNKDAYGYQWWIIDGLAYYAYSARGWYGNHYAFNIIPDLDIIVAIAGNINNGQNYDILKRYIIPSVSGNAGATVQWDNETEN